MSDRGRRLARLAPPLLIAALAIAWLAPEASWLRLPAADRAAAERMTATLDALPEEARVLVGFDPDLGTYAEIRPTVRAMVGDLLARNARLAVVSLTPEGRALASVELARLGRVEAADSSRLLEIGFVAGAEAGLVDLTRAISLPDRARDGAFARRVAENGIGAFNAIVVIGGNDLGPRSWVEQVAPRIEEVPIVAVAPTVLLPEILPYLDRGQLAAVLATPRDGAAYRESLDLGRLARAADATPPRALPLLIGMLIAIALLGQALAVRVLALLRASRGREIE